MVSFESIIVNSMIKKVFILSYYDGIKEEAERIPNLEFVGFVPYPDVNEYFNNASLLVNTSSVEGFQIRSCRHG